MKIKRQKGTNVKTFVAGKIRYEFQGKGPWDIKSEHYRYLEGHFEEVPKKEA